LLTQKRKFVFSEAASEAFEELKEKLSQAPVLRSADFGYHRFSYSQVPQSIVKFLAFMRVV